MTEAFQNRRTARNPKLVFHTVHREVLTERRAYRPDGYVDVDHDEEIFDSSTQYDDVDQLEAVTHQRRSSDVAVVQPERVLQPVGDVAEPKPRRTPGRVITDRTYRGVGLSANDGVLKLRFTQDPDRYKTALQRAGHENIRLVEYSDGTKMELVTRLRNHPDFQDESAQSVFDEFMKANS